MNKVALIPTAMWRNDEWFLDLAPQGKLLWIWMQTNRDYDDAWQSFMEASAETGISEDQIFYLADEFRKAGRIETKGNFGIEFRVFVSDIRCAACGAGIDLTIDHVKPRSWGGSSDPENLQWLCRRCNSSKGNRHDTRY